MDKELTPGIAYWAESHQVELSRSDRLVLGMALEEYRRAEKRRARRANNGGIARGYVESAKRAADLGHRLERVWEED